MSFWTQVCTHPTDTVRRSQDWSGVAASRIIAGYIYYNAAALSGCACMSGQDNANVKTGCYKKLQCERPSEQRSLIHSHKPLDYVPSTSRRLQHCISLGFNIPDSPEAKGVLQVASLACRTPSSNKQLMISGCPEQSNACV